MGWSTIDSQNDLNNFDQSVCWDDSEVLEYYGKITNESYFPNDISRSGYTNKNIHVFIKSDSNQAPYMEMVLIDCDYLNMYFIENISFQGYVDRLKRIEITEKKSSLLMRCSRMIYRFLKEDEIIKGTYFRYADSIT